MTNFIVGVLCLCVLCHIVVKSQPRPNIATHVCNGIVMGVACIGFVCVLLAGLLSTMGLVYVLYMLTLGG